MIATSRPLHIRLAAWPWLRAYLADDGSQPTQLKLSHGIWVSHHDLNSENR
jgi:hypothetical protein